jgi:two-component system response regulator MprA
MLRLEGYDVLTALDVETAFSTMAATPPDAILLDLHMPCTDGVAFLRRLRAREQGRHTPVAIITGDYSIAETLAREISALDAVVLFKPLWLDDLVAIVERLLRTTIH